MQACRLRSHTVDVTPPQAATKIMAGMAEQQTEWRNRMADGMVEWRLNRLKGLLSLYRAPESLKFTRMYIQSIES